MNTYGLFQRSAGQSLSNRLAFAVVLLTATVVGTPVLAQSDGTGNPPARACALLGILGSIPPQCPVEEDDEISDEVQAQLDALQLSVLPFFSYDVALAAGWDTILGECVESPMGGMGYHVHNMDQLANGYLNLLRPEVLLYAPMEDGSMQFHGVEYIIPAELWESEAPPEFLGQELQFNPNVGPNGIWALHVWVGTPNPEGIFEPWNPEVSCRFAPENH
ncbi:MAG: hypothetical protein R6V61_10555 [Wenzhouxiangellaceae bacterium]